VRIRFRKKIRSAGIIVKIITVYLRRNDVKNNGFRVNYP
jgi:hypothetical protein